MILPLYVFLPSKQSREIFILCSCILKKSKSSTTDTGLTDDHLELTQSMRHQSETSNKQKDTKLTNITIP